MPAMSRDDDPAALNWIKSQATKGAMIIGICAGAKVVAPHREGQLRSSYRMKRLDEARPCARAHVPARLRMTRAMVPVTASASGKKPERQRIAEGA